MVEELLYVLQHGPAEPRADMCSVAVYSKYHEGAVLGKKWLDPAKQLMHPADLCLADNKKTPVKCPHHWLILVAVIVRKWLRSSEIDDADIPPRKFANAAGALDRISSFPVLSGKWRLQDS